MDVSIVIPALDEPYLDTLKEKIEHTLRFYGDIEIIVDDSLGCGQAILNGISRASGEVILVMDADGSHNPKYIRYLLANIYDGADISYGIKKINKDTFFRRMVTSGFDVISRILVKDYPDLMSGFFAFKSELSDSLPDEISHPKVLMKLIQNNPDSKVEFVNITFEQRKEGESKLGKPSVAYEIIKDMLKR